MQCAYPFIPLVGTTITRSKQAEILTGALSGNLRTQHEISLLLSGPIAPIFWFHIVVGIFLPLVLLATRRYPMLAGFLAVIGVVAEKIWFLVAGQAEPWLPLPPHSYLPSGLEFIAVIGITALAALVFWALRTWAGRQQTA